jgi:hypothetical protein
MEFWILIAVLVAAALLAFHSLRPRRPSLPDDTVGEGVLVRPRRGFRRDHEEETPEEMPASSRAGSCAGGAYADLTAEAVGDGDPHVACILSDTRRTIAEDDADFGGATEDGDQVRPVVGEAGSAHMRDLVDDIARLISEESSRKNSAIASGLIAHDRKPIETVACEILQTTWGWAAPLEDVDRSEAPAFRHPNDGDLRGHAERAKWLSWRWQGVQFRFVLTIEPEALDDGGEAGLFRLWAEAEEVLRLDVYRPSSGEHGEWHPSTVHSFKEGAWVAILRHFAEWVRLSIS